MARTFDRLAMLWDAVGQYEPGFVLDTCHAWAGGEELVDIVDRVMAITGRIDLVHANNSRDGFDSGADRHANFDSGTFDSELIASVCRDAGCDVIIETPSDGHLTDLAFLRKRLRETSRRQFQTVRTDHSACGTSRSSPCWSTPRVSSCTAKPCSRPRCGSTVGIVTASRASGRNTVVVVSAGFSYTCISRHGAPPMAVGTDS